MCRCQQYGRKNGRSGRGMSEPVRVAIIGSGPAGLSAAARAAQLGLGPVLLEKTDYLSDTISKYQKGKRVLATPDRPDLRSDCRLGEAERQPPLADRAAGRDDRTSVGQGKRVVERDE